MTENPDFLQNQLITYIGNKRALLDFIGRGVAEVQKRLAGSGQTKSKITCLDLFAGSGIVSRYLKQFSSAVTVNDLENYSCIINRCYLSNKSKIDIEGLQSQHQNLCKKIDRKMASLEKSPEGFKKAGFISELYAPASEEQIEKGVKGIAQKTLNLSEIKKMTIPVPPMENQKQFAAFKEQVDKSKVVVQKALDEAQLLFDGLMQQYFG